MTGVSGRRIAMTGLLVALLAGMQVVVADDTRSWFDAIGDQVARPTDPGADDGFNAGALPDLRSASVSGWSVCASGGDPFCGATVDGGLAELVRIDLEFAGLVNPPGPLGLGAFPYEPYRFGQWPVYGFVEIDVDRNRDSGGYLGATAALRYLANVGRFATRPWDSAGERMAQRGADIDADFATSPQYERSGAEFEFGFCGCSDSVLISQNGDMDGLMDEGEAFVVQGRFFRRVASFESVSGVEGGSLAGLYDPLVNALFSHDSVTDVTTVSLVFALTMEGAAELTGEPLEYPDFLVDNHVSVEEALWDLIDGAEGLNGPATTEVWTLLADWSGESPYAHLDPAHWRIAALVGVPYSQPGQALYVWTDTGFEQTLGDFDGDRLSDVNDETAINDFIALVDGSASDADGTVNSAVLVPDIGPGFDQFDVDGDAWINSADVAALQAIIPADFNGDGFVGGADLAVLLADWGSSGAGDLNLDGVVDGADLAALLSAWSF